MLVLSILVFAFSCGADNPYGVYEIHTAEDLVFLATQTGDFSGKTVEFMNDIDMSGTAFNGIGEFAGIMDGQGYKIHNLNIDKPNQESVGLINILGDGGSIKNLTIESGSIKGKNYVGAFVGAILKNSTVTIVGVTNKATVKAVGALSEAIAGGIIGGTYNARESGLDINIDNVANLGSVTATSKKYSNAGGITGYTDDNSSMTISFVYNYGDIVSQDAKGGLVGVYISSYINNSYYREGGPDYYAVARNISDKGSKKITDGEFGTQNTFVGWDFGSIWQMDSNYPVLK